MRGAGRRGRPRRIEAGGNRTMSSGAGGARAGWEKTDGMNWFLQCCRALGAALLLSMATNAALAAPAPAALSPQDTLELQRIAAYLNGIRTMTARFQQIANNGGF